MNACAFGETVMAPPVQANDSEAPDDMPPGPAASCGLDLAEGGWPALTYVLGYVQAVGREPECVDDVARWAEADGLPAPDRAGLSSCLERRSRVATHAAVPDATRRFVQWMQEMGLAGKYESAALDEHWRWFLSDCGLHDLPMDMVRNQIARVPGVTKQRERLRSRTGGEGRVVFYYIADLDDEIEADDDRGGVTVGRGQARPTSPERLAA